ncbi:MAG TPA: hypothetical protein VH063_02800 [Gaiellaceae bacterium]|jgi:hypothetical protein|nr:hypothetical protein [Gaiellaceae bacterium]
MNDRRRIATVAVCCVLAAITPFIAGIAGGAVGLVPLGYAIWLLVRSGWAVSTRLASSALALVATGGLMVGFLILATLSSGD